MKCKLTFVDDTLNRSFYKLGYLVGKNPGYFIIIPILLACICVTGYQRLHYEIDPEYLFSPENGPGKHERAIVEEHFKVNYSHLFSVSRITRPGRFGHVIVIPKDGDINLLRASVWKELRQLDEVIRNTTAVYEGETFRYTDICAKWQDHCSNNDILNLDKIINEVERHELNLTFPVMFNPITWDAHLFPVYFGGTVLTGDMTIKSVPALQMAYFAAADTKRQDAIGAAWEEAFLNEVGRADESGMFVHISVARFASRTLELELEDNTRTIVPYFTSTFIFMALFSIFTCMMTDWVRSKPWLGLLGNLSAGMATVAAFGFCCYLGIDFIGINLASPFLMIGIGIDDTFVMLAAWRRSCITKSVPERMAETLSEAAVSITITSLTDVICFFLGYFSPFPSVQIFCMYSGFAITFTFFFHLTFFSGCLAISGYCEEKNLHSVFCCKVEPLSKSQHKSWLYRLMLSGGINKDDPNNRLDNPEHGCMSWFRDYLAVALNCKIVKAIVILVFLGYLAGAIYGVTTLQEGLDRRKLSKDDSYSIAFYDREDFYFREFPYRIQVIVSGDYDYSSKVIQQQMENLTRSLEATKWISGSVYTESWLRSFLSYIDRNNDYLNVTIDTPESFVQALQEHWLFPSSTYALDVHFDKSRERILGSRFMIQAVNISGTNQEKEMVKDLRKICHDSPLNASVFHPYFVFFDQFELVRPTTIQNMILGAVIMMIISFLFIPNIVCCIWIAFCIGSIELGVFGYMALWGVNLDSISMINLIMCIGFSVDFTAHICYAYMSSKKKDPDDRVKECLYSLGMPIVQGASSTILGLSALLLAGTYIFLVFFKMVFLVIFIGAMHGLFLLPVLLSIFGPGKCENPEDEDEDSKPHNVKDLKLTPYVIPHPTLLYHPSGLKTLPTDPNVGFEDRDPGLGTSEDSNSTESGSSQTRRRNIENEELKKYEAGWRRSVGLLGNLSQFQIVGPPPPPDYPGSNYPAANYQRQPQGNSNSNVHRAAAAAATHYSTQGPRAEYRRSRSQHNLHRPSQQARFLADPRYP